MFRAHHVRIRTNRRHRASCCAAALLWFVAGSPACAQWSLAQFNAPVSEDFALFTAPSTWGTAEPAANQLDSDVWAVATSSVSGSSASVFGLNYIFGQGINTGGVTTFGIYAFDPGTGVRGIGPQATDPFWSPGSLTIKLQNDTASEIDKLRVEWSYLAYNDKSGSRVSQLLISDTDADGSYLAVATGGTLLTQDAPQPTPSWIISPRDVTINVSIPVGDDYYLRWSFADLAGAEGSGENRDEVGIGDLRVTAVRINPGDYNRNGVVDAADYTVWRDHLGDAGEAALHGNGNGMNGVDEADYDLWKLNFGKSILGSDSLWGPPVPEPATWLLCLSAAAAWAGAARIGRR